VCFLTHRFQQQLKIARQPGLIVQDRSLYEDAEIFAANLHRQGFIDARDWQTYRELYETMASVVPAPALPDTHLFEIACRLQEVPMRLGSTYACDGARICMAPAGDAIPLPGTVQWTYMIGPGGIQPVGGSSIGEAS
jgi:hypothetical protein